LEEEEEGKKREELRLMKARIALGEMEVVGDKVWAGLVVKDHSVEGAASIPGPERKPDAKKDQVKDGARPSESKGADR
jgi:hypothetical protein